MISILLSKNYINGGLKYKSLETLNSLLELRNDSNISDYDLSYIYSTIGNIYLNLKLYNKALNYHLRTLKIVQTLNNSKLISLTYHTLAITETKLYNLPKAKFM